MQVIQTHDRFLGDDVEPKKQRGAYTPRHAASITHTTPLRYLHSNCSGWLLRLFHPCLGEDGHRARARMHEEDAKFIFYFFSLFSLPNKVLA